MFSNTLKRMEFILLENILFGSDVITFKLYINGILRFLDYTLILFFQTSSPARKSIVWGDKTTLETRFFYPREEDDIVIGELFMWLNRWMKI